MGIKPTSNKALDYLWFGQYCINLAKSGNGGGVKACADGLYTVICKFDAVDAVLMVIGGGNFITYPRSGAVIQKNFQREDGQVIPYWYVDGPGFDNNGNALNLRSLENIPYPLNQLMPNGSSGPWGAKAFVYDATSTPKWSYEPDVGPYYGNIDWKGPLVQGAPDERIVLTWVGSPSRYFPQSPVIASEMRYSAFDSRVFRSGEIYATLPKAVIDPLSGSFPYEPVYTDIGDEIPYVVLGCGVCKDTAGTEWLVVVGRWYATSIKGSLYNHFSVMAIQAGISDNSQFYHVADNPSGWRMLLDETPETVGFSSLSAWFFNELGTEAVCANLGNLYHIAIDINQKLAVASIPEANIIPISVGSGSYNSGDPINTTQIMIDGGSGSRTTTTSGSINYNQGKYLIAADFKGSTLVKAYISHSGSVGGTMQSDETFEWENVDDACANKVGYIHGETKRTVTNTSGDYTINLEMPNRVIAIGTGSETLSSIYDYNLYADGIVPKYDPIPSVIVTGPAGAGVGAVYTAGGGRGGPYSYSMQGGSIDSATGTVTSINTNCATNGGRTYATVIAQDKCGGTGTIDVYFNSQAGSWQVTGCSMSGCNGSTYCNTPSNSPEWTWIGAADGCQTASYGLTSVTITACRWNGTAWVSCGSVSWERYCP